MKHTVKFDEQPEEKAMMVSDAPYAERLGFEVPAAMASKLSVETVVSIEAKGVIEEIGTYGNEDYHIRVRLTELTVEDKNEFSDLVDD